MRKLFNIFAAALIALSFASCGEENAPEMPKDFPTTDNLKNFSVEFQTLQADYAEVEVTSADKDCYFFFSFMKADLYAQKGSREAQ